MAAAVAVVAVLWWQFVRPRTLTESLNATCRIETASWYAVVTDSGDTLRLSPADGRLTDAEDALFRADTTCQTAAYVTTDGYAVTTDAAVFRAADTLAADTLSRLLLSERERLQRLSDNRREALKELDYYADTHTVTDDGYNAVMAYRDRCRRVAARADSLLTVVNEALGTKNTVAVLHSEITLTSCAAVAPRSSSDSLRRYAISKRRAAVVGRRAGLLLLRTADGHTPLSAGRLCLFGRASASSPRVLLSATADSILAVALPESVADSMGTPFTEGAIAVDRRGRIAGVRSGGRLVPTAEVRRLCRAFIGGAAFVRGNALADLRRMFLPAGFDSTETAVELSSEMSRNIAGRHRAAGAFAVLPLPAGRYAGHVVSGQPDGRGLMAYADGRTYLGQWLKGKRHGDGTLSDTLRHAFTGRWTADTLAAGVFTAPDHRYVGCFDDSLHRHGYGRQLDDGGSYYEGEWQHDVRHGFGFSVRRRHMVRAGIWRNDLYRGEQMIYTPDRVYGIDISRYQHEQGRKRYAIDFSDLRVTRLGTSAAARVRGKVDYPVTFVYVKASEGTSTRNRYYAADVAACRRHGIRVGAYHFFSTKKGGTAQAQHFLRTALPHVGDLPPVLDVEPSDAQIQAMGGSRALFREMSAWIALVEKRCGTTPVIYISQSFVNKYMADAPASVTRCGVWVARYGAYRPYVRLLHWQLSPYGRINGIRGDVDINVFNGTRDQFADYLTRACVRTSVRR